MHRHGARIGDMVLAAAAEIRANLLRSFFTVLGITVSVTFLVAVVAIIQGMNAYVETTIAGAIVGANSFQVRRTPISVGGITDEMIRLFNRRPRIGMADAQAVIDALPNALAIGVSGGGGVSVNAIWTGQTLSGVNVLGVTPPYLQVQDYRIEQGDPLTDIDVTQRRAVAVIGHDVADKLFGQVSPIGRQLRLGGDLVTVIGVAAPKGSFLGRSADMFALLPLTRYEMSYGLRPNAVIGVKMRTAEEVAPAMARAEETMRVAHRLRPGEPDNFAVETASALVDFWKRLTAVLFSVIPAFVAIGVVVGGIVIMNIMLMVVTERTREVGIRKAVGATRRDIQRQFLSEAVMLSMIGGLLGVLTGWGAAHAVATLSPLPARITLWSVGVAIVLGAGAGVLFGVYPARRAALLDPIIALGAE
jgi:putative ABC transport system permease protein